MSLSSGQISPTTVLKTWILFSQKESLIFAEGEDIIMELKLANCTPVIFSSGISILQPKAAQADTRLLVTTRLLLSKILQVITNKRISKSIDATNKAIISSK